MATASLASTRRKFGVRRIAFVTPGTMGSSGLAADLVLMLETAQLSRAPTSDRNGSFDVMAMHSFAAASLWMMGREAEADAALQSALSLPEKFAHAPSIVFSLAFNSFMLLHRRIWPRVREQSLRAVMLSQEEGFRMWLPLGQFLIGLCDAAEDKLESGLDAAFEAFDRFAATGTGVCQSHVHAPVGEFLIAAGRAEEAVRRLDARIESAIRRQERVYLSELYRARGLAHRELAAFEKAQADFATACDIARSQGAVTFLRRAEESLRAIMAK